MTQPTAVVDLESTIPSIESIFTPKAPVALQAPVAKPNRHRPRWMIGLGVLSLMALGGWGIRSAVRSGIWRRESPIASLPRTTVAKVDLSVLLTASGRVESTHNTIITCELERLEIRNGPQTMSSGGASMILSLLPEGSRVTKGELICRLDAADYEELVRNQEMKTEQSYAALRQAELSFDVAELAVQEYRDGLFYQNIQSMEGSIALASSNLERAIDRLQWTSKMLVKGYTPTAAKADAEQTLSQCRLDLQTYRFNLSNFREYISPKALKVLANEVEMRRYEVVANTQRVTRNRERLAYYKTMVEKCSIHAPHDGLLIYAADYNRPSSMPIAEGQTVRQSQKLFFLPDLANMEVQTYLHESIASRVLPGMRAKVRIEGLASRMLEGHVVSMAPLPTSGGNWVSDEVKFFVGVVKLDSIPNGLRPGMSAEVEFDVDRRLDVLAVPTEAIAVEQGHNVCYVAGVDGLERRSVTLGRSSRDLLEVTKGLSLGDEVVLRPEKIEFLDSLLANTSKDHAAEPESSNTENFAPASASSPVSVE